MTDKPIIRALVGCQVLSCAQEHSFPLADVRLWNGRPICQDCWNIDQDDGRWHELPPVKLTDLTE